MKLEELARQASTDARTSVSRLDPPSIGEPDRPRWLVPAVAGVAVTALVVGGLVVINRNGGIENEAVPAATVPAVADPPRLGLRDGVDDWTPASASAMGEPLRGEGSAIPTFQYYGTAGSDDPFANGDLVIGFVRDADDETQTDGDPIVVRGQDGIIAQGAEEFGFDTTLLSWREDTPTGTIDLIVVSRSLDRAALMAVAESIVVDPDGNVTPSDRADLDLLAAAPGLLALGLGADDGWMSTYLGVDAWSFVSITSSSARLADERVALTWWSGEGETITIGETEVFLATSTPDDLDAVRGRTLLWSPESGVVATMQVVGAPDVDLIALFDDVVELTPAEWSELADSTSLMPDGPVAVEDGTQIIAEGGSDGAIFGWIASVENGNVCVEISTTSGGGASCGEPGSTLVGTGSADVWAAGTADGGFADGEAVRWAVIVADPTVDEIRSSDPQLVVGRFEWDGSSWFVLGGRAGDDTEVDVVIGGDVVDTLDFAAEGADDVDGVVIAADPLAAEFPVLATAGHGDVVFVADGETDGLRWAIGESVAGLCLYTAGATDSISCNEFGGIAVFPTVEVDSATWTFVYSIHRDSCPIVLSSGTSRIVDMQTDRVTSAWIVEGESDGWQFGVENQQVDLPPRTGSIEWPEGTCEP